MRLPDDYQIHQQYRVVCHKKTGKHRYHAYNRATLTDAQTTLDILAQASWTVDCRPFTLEERTVSPWEAAKPLITQDYIDELRNRGAPIIANRLTREMKKSSRRAP